MNHLPEQVKFMFLIALIILMMFAGFIVMVVMVYKKETISLSKRKVAKRYSV